ncbi:MAG: PIN domain-containing protein [bacterium]|nr:PIN domain-containing protein [bacterium]MDE0600424.1 PIN domain-containing protein [bacterium]
MIADTSGLIPYFNESDPDHEAVVTWIEAKDPDMVVSPFVVGEIDYLVATRLGVQWELEVLRELAGGAYHLATIDADDLVAATEVVERYRDLGIGITDASLVVLAERYRTRTILTLDQRHFNVLRPLDGGHFKLVP